MSLLRALLAVSLISGCALSVASPQPATLLSIQGSNTVGAALAPALIEGLFRQQGFSVITRRPGRQENEQTIQARKPDGSWVGIAVAAHDDGHGRAQAHGSVLGVVEPVVAVRIQLGEGLGQAAPGDPGPGLPGRRRRVRHRIGHAIGGPLELPDRQGPVAIDVHGGEVLAHAGGAAGPGGQNNDGADQGGGTCDPDRAAR